MSLRVHHQLHRVKALELKFRKYLIKVGDRYIMTFTQAIQEIRVLSREDITTIVADYVDLKRSGKSMKGCCPFHDEKTPSFHVSDPKGIYKCFGCGTGGDAIDFLMRMEGKEFHEVIYQLANRYNITLDNSGGSKSDRKTEASEIIPDLKVIRSAIRKEGLVTIDFSKQADHIDDKKAIVRIKAPLTAEQSEVLRKCTEYCELNIGEMSWPDLFDTISNALKCDLNLSIKSGTQSKDWLHYILDTYQPERKEIVKLLSSITDDINRSVYMTEYSNMMSNNREVQRCQ